MSKSVTVQINWADSDVWPDMWTADGNDVSAHLRELHISNRAANPRITVDTCSVVLHDPTGRFIPAKVDSPLYPNVRENRRMRVLITVNGNTFPLFYGLIRAYAPVLRPIKLTTIRAESPIRSIPNAQAAVHATTGALVNGDGTTGAVPTVLDTIVALVPAVPAANRQLDPTPDDSAALGGADWTGPPEALEQFALLSDSLYGAHPRYRVASDGVDWVFFWQARGAKLGVVADETWSTEAGDSDDLIPTYTGDVIWA